MPWLRMSDNFEDNPKVAMLSDTAHRLHVRALCWSHKAENLHTQGFVPTVLLPQVSMGLTGQKLKRLVRELVEANAGGTKEHGLWEPRDGGYQIHDWEDYQPDSSSTQRARELTTEEKGLISEKRALAGRKGGLRSGQIRSKFASTNEASLLQRTKQTGSKNEANGEALASPLPPKPPLPLPDPVPDPDLLATADPKTDQVDRAEKPLDSPQRQSEEPSGKIPCPSDLRLPDETLATWASGGISVPRWAADAIAIGFVGRYVATPSDKRTHEQWMRGLCTTVLGNWRNASKRAELQREHDSDETDLITAASQRKQIEDRIRFDGNPLLRKAPRIEPVNPEAAARHLEAFLEGRGS